MLMLEYKDIGWWYWLISAILIAAGLSGRQEAYLLVVLLNIINLFHFIVREKSCISFPIQVRAGFLLLLLVAYPEPLRVIYWIPGVGLWAQVIFGYCAMARCMSIMPWNKQEKYSATLLKEIFFSKPVKGNIMQGFAE